MDQSQAGGVQFRISVNVEHLHLPGPTPVILMRLTFFSFPKIEETSPKMKRGRQEREVPTLGGTL